jgi:hypothetical protein
MPLIFFKDDKLSKMGKTTASVFPDPVLAMINTFFPSLIRGIPFSWGNVKVSNPRSSISFWIVSDIMAVE